jgi:hypothetical protein
VAGFIYAIGRGGFGFYEVQREDREVQREDREVQREENEVV